jgi:regulator of sirC expression with transglutaminase-like and TPR domain
MTDRVDEVPRHAGQGSIAAGPKMPAREIRALASLLGDEDGKIVTMVWENLLRLGQRALPYLHEIEEDPDPRTRLRARHVKMRIEAQRLEKRFRRLSLRRDGAFDLEAAMTLVAQIEYPDLDPADVALALDELAEGLRPQIRDGQTAPQQVELLIHYLFRDLKFRGNREQYHDPDNSFIHRVLDRRLGIPITLAAVMILVGRRLRMPLYGVSLPRNFLVRYQDHTHEIFIDPFSGGRILSREECARILTSEGYYVREAFVSEYLAIASARDMVIRMLRNLVFVYSKLRDGDQVRRLIRYIEILRARQRAR